MGCVYIYKIIKIRIINYLGLSWAPVHRLNENFLARVLPKLACI